MENKTQNKINDLVDALTDKELEISNTENKMVDYVENLKYVTANFIQQRFNKITGDEEFEKLILDSLKEKIQEGEVKISDLMTLLNQNRIRSVEAVDSLLNFFKPSQSSAFPLENPNQPKGGLQEAFESNDPQVLQIIQEFSNLIGGMIQKNKEIE